MRLLTIILGIALAAPVAGAEALGTSSVVTVPVDEAAPAPATNDAEVPVITVTTAAGSAVTSTVLGAVFALSPAVTLASTGAIAISANDPFDGGDDADATADAGTPTAGDAMDQSDTTAGETVAVASEPAAPPTKVALPTKVPSEQELRVQYQHVGRDLLKLVDQRGKFDCGGVIPRFKAIKLDQALATPASRMQLYVDLTDMALKIDRLRGIHIDAQCLQNPLAAGCM